MPFDLDDYTRRAARLDVVDLDLADGFRDQPLDDDTLRCLRYMHDIESHTACYLRDILVTKAHRDPDITTFLTLWSFEEHWHGDAIAAVLRAHERTGGRERVAEVRNAQGRMERLRPLAFVLASALLPDITAIHLTWGAINEWTTQAGYARLASRADHPLLAELLRRIMRQEGRHIDFYASEARARLDASSGARRTTRFALRHAWQPVGTGVRPQSEVDFVVRHLFDGVEGEAMAARIDRRVDLLPGLAGLDLVTTARREALARS
jgi:rubrerythrin